MSPVRNVRGSRATQRRLWLSCIWSWRLFLSSALYAPVVLGFGMDGGPVYSELHGYGLDLPRRASLILLDPFPFWCLAMMYWPLVALFIMNPLALVALSAMTMQNSRNRKIMAKCFWRSPAWLITTVLILIGAFGFARSLRDTGTMIEYQGSGTLWTVHP